MLICFFYRLKGDKTSSEYIKSFIGYLKIFYNKVIYFPQIFPKVVFHYCWKACRGDRIRACDLVLPKHLTTLVGHYVYKLWLNSCGVLQDLTWQTRTYLLAICWLFLTINKRNWEQTLRELVKGLSLNKRQISSDSILDDC